MKHLRQFEDWLNEKGLWDNIRAKKARGEKPARKGSAAYKKAVDAAKKIKNESLLTEAKSVSSKLEVLKDHLDRSNIDLANWIVKNLDVKTKGEMTEEEAIRIIKSVNVKDMWPKLPTMYFFDSPAEDVKDGTLLLHFTRHPNEIAKEGFKHGEPDYLKLGMNWGHVEKGAPGYNYAFDPKDLIEKYGSLDKAFNDWVPSGGVIFFYAPAIKDWHFGDEIEQVIFWGPEAREITPVIKSYGKWIFQGEKYSTLEEIYDILSHTNL